MTLPGRVQLSAFLAFVLLSLTTHGQSARTPIDVAGTATQPNILDQLAPDGVPPSSLHLKPSERPRAIQELLTAKRNETGFRQQLAEYLLASLGHDYTGNRQELLHVW
ncbi:MAG: hypothetical protein ACRD3S_14105, partial [Terracidiphilus sp.]